jgi:hypothetical protein
MNLVPNPIHATFSHQKFSGRIVTSNIFSFHSFVQDRGQTLHLMVITHRFFQLPDQIYTKIVHNPHPGPRRPEGSTVSFTHHAIALMLRTSCSRCHLIRIYILNMTITKYTPSAE